MLYNYVVRATIESDNLESFLKYAVSLDCDDRLFKGDRVICSGLEMEITKIDRVTVKGYTSVTLAILDDINESNFNEIGFNIVRRARDRAGHVISMTVVV